MDQAETLRNLMRARGESAGDADSRASGPVYVAGDPGVEREWIASRIERELGVPVTRIELDDARELGDSARFICLLAPGQLPVAQTSSRFGVIVKGVADPRRARAAYDEMSATVGDSAPISYLGHVPRIARRPRGAIKKILSRLLVQKYLLDLDSGSAGHLSLALDAAMELLEGDSGRFTEEPAHSARGDT